MAGEWSFDVGAFVTQVASKGIDTGFDLLGKWGQNQLLGDRDFGSLGWAPPAPAPTQGGSAGNGGNLPNQAPAAPIPQAQGAKNPGSNAEPMNGAQSGDLFKVMKGAGGYSIWWTVGAAVGAAVLVGVIVYAAK